MVIKLIYHERGKFGRSNDPFSFHRYLFPASQRCAGWVKQALKDSLGDKQKTHDESLSRLQAEIGRLDTRLDGLYLDKLDGRITLAVYDRLSTEWREQRQKLMAQMQSHQQASDNYHIDGVMLLELAQNAVGFTKRSLHRKSGGF